tara:strand:- start:943 stop:1398 length:456 start_codon:yes stop_codon:yes gene_type:complete
MAFSSLTLTRNNIDALEELTFKGINVTSGTTTLNLSEKDNLILAKAIKLLKTDILDNLREFINDTTYSTETALLDAIHAVDSEELLVDLLSFKFLELWFAQDATHRDSYSYEKARKYYAMYNQYLTANLRRLSGLLSTPKTTPRVRFMSLY